MMKQIETKTLADTIKNGDIYLFAGRGCGKTELVRKLNAERMALNSLNHCDAAKRYITERNK